MYIMDVIYDKFSINNISFASKKQNAIPFSFLCILLFSFTLMGCTNNVVTLSYPLAHDALSPDNTRNISVCIVDFSNNRKESAVGKQQNNTQLLPRTPVERWLATGLALELQHAGFQILMAESLPEAIARKADYIVTGESEEVWLMETSITRYTGVVRASISLLDGVGNHITRNAYSSVYSKAVLPIYGVPQTLLDDALVEMLQPAVDLLAKTMQ